MTIRRQTGKRARSRHGWTRRVTPSVEPMEVDPTPDETMEVDPSPDEPLISPPAHNGAHNKASPLCIGRRSPFNPTKGSNWMCGATGGTRNTPACTEWKSTATPKNL